MAAPVPLSTMRTAVRELANEEATQYDFIPVAELDRRINEAIHELYDLLIECRGQEYYVRQHNITTAASTASYSLPADFYQLIGIILDDGSNVVDVYPWSPGDIARLYQLQRSGGSSIYSTRYRLQKDNLELRPCPTAAWTLTMRYVPVCPTLIDAADTFDGINGWEKWAYLRAALDVLTKGENDTAAIQQQLAAMSARIKAHAGNRDSGQPDVIVDTRHDWQAADGYLLADDWDY